MTIDMSPMSTFLTIALFVIGIPGVILSVVVWFKITQRFFNERDYEHEMLPDSDHDNTAQFHGKGGPAGAKQASHAAGGKGVNERMIQSG